MRVRVPLSFYTGGLGREVDRQSYFSTKPKTKGEGMSKVKQERRKREKALDRHKAVVKSRNIRTNNLAYNPARYVPGRSRSYQLYNI